MRFYRMNAMAICADWSLTIAPHERLSMNALHELGVDGLVAFPARAGHVEFENRRLGIRRPPNFMRAVAIRADRSRFHSIRNRTAMHALLIGGERLCSSCRLHHKLLVVAASASGGNVGVVRA